MRVSVNYKKPINKINIDHSKYPKKLCRREKNDYRLCFRKSLKEPSPWLVVTLTSKVL